MNAILKNMQSEEQDGFLVTAIIHLLILFLFIFPVMRFVTKPPVQVPAISVVFNQPIEEAEYTPVSKEESTKRTETPKETKKAVVKAVVPEEKTPPPAKAKEIVVEDVSPAPAVVESKVTTEKSAEVLAAEAKAKREAEEAAKAAKLKASKSQFGSLFDQGNGGSPEESTDIGSQNSDALDAISSGVGTIGEGLSSRGITYKPTITDQSDREGRVIVNICIDSSGKVTSADFVQSGSTTSDQNLISTALKGAKQYKFEVNDGVKKQCGDITIEFEVR